MNSFPIDRIVAFPFREEEPKAVARARRRIGVALCGLGTALCGAGFLFAGTVDWLASFGAVLGIGGLCCFSAFRLGAERDLRKLYGGGADVIVRQTEAETHL